MLPLPLRLGDAASSGPGYALPLLDDAREQALGLVVPFAMQRAGPAPEPNRGAPLGRSSDNHTHTPQPSVERIKGRSSKNKFLGGIWKYCWMMGEG